MCAPAFIAAFIPESHARLRARTDRQVCVAVYQTGANAAYQTVTQHSWASNYGIGAVGGNCYTLLAVCRVFVYPSVHIHMCAGVRATVCTNGINIVEVLERNGLLIRQWCVCVCACAMHRRVRTPHTLSICTCTYVAAVYICLFDNSKNVSVVRPIIRLFYFRCGQAHVGYDFIDFRCTRTR